MSGFQSKRLMAVSGGWVAAEFQEPNLKILDKTLVDGEPWYTVSCLRETSIWLRETFKDQEDKQWFQNIDQRWHINFNVFDVNEEIYSMLMLRWL